MTSDLQTNELEPPVEFEPRADRRPVLARRALLCVLILQFLLVGAVQSWRDSPTVDEYVHLPQGVTALDRHQLRLTLEHPPLPYVVAAIPVLFAHPTIPRSPEWKRGDGHLYPRQFMLEADRAGKLQEIVFLSRLVSLLEGALVAVLLYLLGRKLFGVAAGLIAAAAWSTLPLAVGMSHVNGIDIAATLCTVAFALLVLRYTESSTPRRAVALGAMIGVALLCTFSAFALFAAAALAVVVCLQGSGWRVVVRHLAVIATALWATVWLGYRIISPFPHFHHVDPAPEAGIPVTARLMRLVPWPHEFAVGFTDLLHVSAERRSAYLFGQEWTGHRWWFWPGSLVVKLPATTLLLLVLGAVMVVVRRERRVLLAIVAPLAVVGLSTVLNAQNFGVRYLLPVIALGLVLGAGAVVHIATHEKRTRLLFILLAGAQLFWFWQAEPNSIAWTAPPFRPGYQYVTDSNVDWGQDLYRLRAWAQGRPMFVAYFGGPGSSAGWDAARSFRFHNPYRAQGLTGTVVVSASDLTGKGRSHFGWLRAYCPVKMIGRTLLVYQFDDLVPRPEIPVRPRGLCKSPGLSSN